MSKDESERKSTVTVVHRVNRIKEKVSEPANAKGPGSLDPNMIKKAQAIVDGSQSLYAKEEQILLSELQKLWEASKALQGNEAKKSLEKLYLVANRIKDMASTHEYSLMAYFAESLRDFFMSVNVESKSHQTIVRAHLDVMRITAHEKIKRHTDAKAEELKAILGQAIKKLSSAPDSQSS